jgi:MarR family transcriptional regulator, lower aerobic nicotinate degradation pathway regulator
MAQVGDLAGSTDADDDARDALVETSFTVQDLLGEVAENRDLSLTQLRLLGILRDREPGMLELAGYLKLEKSSVSGLVDRAEQRGLVRRRPGPGDGRTVHVGITRRGRAIVEQIEHDLAEPLARLLRPLPKRQRAQLAGLLRTLLDDRG